MQKFTIALLRVSGLDQETTLQRHALMDEIKSRGLEIVYRNIFLIEREKWLKKDNVCIFVEDKSTGTNEKRSGYQWTLQEVRSGHVKAVLVFRGDRVGRSVVSNWNFAKACLDRKTELFSLKDKLDITSPLGKMMFSVMSAAAEYQSDVYSENVKAGIKAARAKAEAQGKEYHHGGTAKGWSHRRLIKQLPYFYKLIELGMSNYGIRQVLKWNYRTITKYRKMKIDEVIDRKTLNTKVYGKSNAKI